MRGRCYNDACALDRKGKTGYKSDMSHESQIEELLKNYRAFVRQIDDHIERIEAAHPDKISCKKGCDACCRFLTLFPVEALSLAQAFNRLDPDIRDRIADRLNPETEACPLLINRACALYEARPVICRTHGYPIYMESEREKARIDFCPENFKGMASFPKEVLISLETLNTTLAAINRHFLAAAEIQAPLPDRIPVSQALFMLDESE